MSESDKHVPGRRALLKQAIVGLAGIPVVAAVGRAAAQGTPARLDEKDPAAVALGYLHDATKVDPSRNPTWKAGQTCANCLQIQGADGEAWRGCNLFPGKQVAAAGWCRVWVQKPGA